MVDEMDLLSRMKDAAPLRAEAFEEARTKLCAAMAVNAHPGTEPRQGGRSRKPAWGTRGKVGFGITAVAAAAAAVALGVTSSPTPSHPAASHPASKPGAQLAAWTVTRQAGGIIHVSFFGELRDPAGLQRTLRADGVPASVTFIGQQNPACHSVNQGGQPPSPGGGRSPGSANSGPGSGNGTWLAANGPGDALAIRPSELPPGDGVQIAVMQGIPAGPSGPWPHPKGSGYPVAEVGLVQASPQCTGS
jgi:hypothetical protein